MKTERAEEQERKREREKSISLSPLLPLSKTA
jgi:hypothetical protein